MLTFRRFCHSGFGRFGVYWLLDHACISHEWIFFHRGQSMRSFLVGHGMWTNKFRVPHFPESLFLRIWVLAFRCFCYSGFAPLGGARIVRLSFFPSRAKTFFDESSHVALLLFWLGTECEHIFEFWLNEAGASRDLKYQRISIEMSNICCFSFSNLRSRHFWHPAFGNITALMSS